MQSPSPSSSPNRPASSTSRELDASDADLLSGELDAGGVESAEAEGRGGGARNEREVWRQEGVEVGFRREEEATAGEEEEGRGRLVRSFRGVFIAYCW